MVLDLNVEGVQVWRFTEAQWLESSREMWKAGWALEKGSKLRIPPSQVGKGSGVGETILGLEMERRLVN